MWNSTFVCTTEKKVQKKFEKIQKCFEFWIFGSHRVLCERKRKKNREKLRTQNFKNPKQYLCEDQWEENSEKVWKESKAI